jgi:hypothetical protein
MVQVIPELAPIGFDVSRIGAGLGAGLGRGFQQGSDASRIDEILKQARAAGMESSDVIDRILGSSLSPDFKKLAIDALQNQEQLAARAQKAPQEKKPGIKAAAELKGLGTAAIKLPGRIADLQRALELLDEGVTTGPYLGRFAQATGIQGEAQQEFGGIASRLLTSSFATLPRITAEFESFKGGQVSLRLSNDVNRRNIENQLEAARLEERIINRIEELTAQGVDEESALNTAKRETSKDEEKLFSKVKRTKKLVNRELSKYEPSLDELEAEMARRAGNASR